MYASEKQFERTIQVEQVDNQHPRWNEVLEAIAELGQRDLLGLEPDGWLAARHVLLVAFVDDEVAGHISFGVQPARGGSAGRTVIVAARLESQGVQWRFSDLHVDRVLSIAARRRARSIGCRQLVEFDDVDFEIAPDDLTARCA